MTCQINGISLCLFRCCFIRFAQYFMKSVTTKPNNMLLILRLLLLLCLSGPLYNDIRVSCLVMLLVNQNLENETSLLLLLDSFNCFSWKNILHLYFYKILGGRAPTSPDQKNVFLITKM